ncbi:ABC transporter ATP-binding protein [Suicoccus acidiformans]|uniref:ABC transporter ATP-binding protein n=1 Tax=Suicoccus acidiformans TaxID=2036206 RepID=A0A347WKF4_9LACT|nr:ATP-binding cassette domain-containing protein [Suicoccus acidiformans]AXY25561.1 ABC transporter ATP-binding protein [Suicoccus acidiformans]
MPQTQVSIQQINKQFPSRSGDPIHGLKNLSLDIQAGEVIAVIGTNGAGKSTLFNCLTGQYPIDSGAIYLDGKQVDGLSQVERAAHIGRVFQDPTMGTAPRMTVFENLTLAQKRGASRGLGISLTQERYHNIREYLASFRLDLEHRMDVPIGSLSGGQRQIISLIMATIKQPKLLLLDEHTAALDPRIARQVMEMTHTMIKEQDLTTLMITHHHQDALNFSDRIIVMHHGQIVDHYDSQAIKSLTTADLYARLEDLVLAEEAIL